MLIGGLPTNDDLTLLKTKPDLIVGTVGRISLHFQSASLVMDMVRLAIFDEADILIKGKDFRKLFGMIRHERSKRPLQICCYSATFNKINYGKYVKYIAPCIKINNNCTIKFDEGS